MSRCFQRALVGLARFVGGKVHWSCARLRCPVIPPLGTLHGTVRFHCISADRQPFYAGPDVASHRAVATHGQCTLNGEYNIRFLQSNGLFAPVLAGGNA